MSEVLLAEDNPADVYLIREALREYGVDCTVRVAPDGREVLQILTGELPGVEALRLIILDLNLPRHDGIEILEHLLGRFADPQIIPAGAKQNHPWLIGKNDSLGEMG